MGYVARLYHPRSQRPITVTTQMHQGIPPNHTLIQPTLASPRGNHCGSDDSDCHTHKLAIALCALQRPTCPQSGAIDRHPTGMYQQQRNDNGDQSTIWRGHTRPTRSPKEGKRKGHISKELCANTDLCPLASPRVALVGVRLLRHPDKGNTR